MGISTHTPCSYQSFLRSERERIVVERDSDPSLIQSAASRLTSDETKIVNRYSRRRRYETKIILVFIKILQFYAT